MFVWLRKKYLSWQFLHLLAKLIKISKSDTNKKHKTRSQQKLTFHFHFVQSNVHSTQNTIGVSVNIRGVKMIRTW